MYLTSSNNIIPQLFKNFVLGGLTIASVSYMATFLNPILASIWWSYPISIIPVIYFMKQNKVTNAHISRFLLGITVVSILTLLSCYLLSYFIKNSKTGLLYPIIKSSLCWLIGCALFYALVEYGGYTEYFI
jgi:hypothetical protein